MTARKTTAQKAADAIEAAFNAWADEHKPGWTIVFDRGSATSNRSSRAHGYDCASWEISGTWMGPRGEQLAGPVAVWCTMSAIAKHGAVTLALEKYDVFPTEACSRD